MIGFKVENPAIYFGEEPDNYAVVDSATPEFDYPKGADNVFSFYKERRRHPGLSELVRRPNAIQLLLQRQLNLAGSTEEYRRRRAKS